MTPGKARELLQQARACQARGRIPEAMDIGRRVLKGRPRDFSPNYFMATLHAQQGAIADAVQFFEAAVAIKPDMVEAQYNLAYALNVIGRHGDAALHYEEVLKRDPQNITALVNYANTLNALGRYADALAVYDGVILHAPDSAAVYTNRGFVLKQLKRLDEALADCDRAIAIDSNFADAHFNRGVVLHQMKRFDESLDGYDKAIHLKRGYAEAYFNRGATLHDMSRFEEALEAYNEAIRLKRDYAEAYFNRGTTLHELSRFDEALANYDRALALDPGHGRTLFARSQVNLLRGDFGRGWPDYEWRKGNSAPEQEPRFPQPRWQPEEDVAGKTILLHTEQGLGDTIQFCRYVPLLRRRGARVLFAPQPPLRALMKSLDGGADVVDSDDSSLGFDLHYPLLSLPLALKTRLDTIPAVVPYLSADPQRAKTWADKIGSRDFKIGICWQGGVTNIDQGRSFHVREFYPVSQVPGVRLISLHKGEGEAQLADLPAGMAVETLGGDFDAGPDAFMDTAAVMQGLDLIITSDTAVAHLAGALGKPTWVVLQHVPDWRWLLDRGDSPWYPATRLFRQPKRGDWQSAFSEVTVALRAALQGRE